MAQEKVVSFEELIDEIEAQGDEESLPEPDIADEISLPEPKEEALEETLPEELQTKEAKGILRKIDEGIFWAEKGVKQYFNNAPKRAVEFQQNYISLLELKAKILKLITDTGIQRQQQVNAQQNNIIVDPDSAKELIESLKQKLHGNG